MIVAGWIWQDRGPGEDDFCAGWFEAEGGVVVRSGLGDCPDPVDYRANGLVTPGFVDVHCHAGKGASFTEGAAAAQVALAAHHQAGTGTLVASLVSDTLDNLLDQIAQLAPLVESGELAGIHLEGPWLAPERRGAHDPSKLSWPTADAVQAIVELPPGLVRMVTIAPELPGAPAAIERLTGAGIVVALGHTQAGYGQTMAAFDLGATGITHLFNGMPKTGGPAQAAIDRKPSLPRPGVPRRMSSRARDHWRQPDSPWLELIFDNHHVPPEQAAELCRKEPGRVVLITDAMAAAGMGDGDYTLGGLEVRVVDGVARLESGNLAGSTLTLADALLNAVAAGVPLTVAVRQVTANPADYLRLHAGRLEPGYLADHLELDPQGRVLRGTSQATGLPPSPGSSDAAR
jgi:N-acetylglucosamine-6-phosphate deacetylase